METNYVLVKHKSECGDFYAFHRVDSNFDEPLTYCKEPVKLIGESVAELQDIVNSINKSLKTNSLVLHQE